MVTSGPNGNYKTKTYHSGRIGEKVKYFVPDTRSEKKGKSTQQKISSNASTATRRMARALNAGFRPGDAFITLGVDEVGYTRILDRAATLDQAVDERDRILIAAQHELKLLFDRARPALLRQGVELRYIAVASDMDGKTGDPVRVHFHMVVPKDCAKVILEKWPYDQKPKTRRLWKTEDYTQLAAYMLNQVRHIPNLKKYMPSRNLIRPEPKERKVKSGAPLRAPKGCKLLYADAYTGDKGCQYIRYLLPPEQWTGVWKKKPKGGRKRAKVQDAGKC